MVEICRSEVSFCMPRRGYGRSKKGIERRKQASFDAKLKKWIERCLEVNKKLEERAKMNNPERGR